MDTSLLKAKPIERVIDALASRDCHPKQNGDSWKAKCPAHDGKDRDSLTVTEGSDGKVLTTCHSKECSYFDVMRSLELDPADGFVKTREFKGKPLGIREPFDIGSPSATYDYVGADGSLVLQVNRYDLADGGKEFRQRRPDGSGGWIWKTAGMTDRPLYHLPKLLEAPDDVVFVVEGEKCVAALEDNDFVATTSSQGALSPDKTDWSPLAGRPVIIVPDNDDRGREYGDQVAALVTAAGAKDVSILTLPGLPEKGDVYDWLAAGHDAADFLEVADSAVGWKSTSLRIRTLREFCAVERKPAEVLVSPWMRSGSIGMLYAWRGGAKSYFGITLAVCMASGVSFLTYPVRRQCSVLYIDGEMSTNELEDRTIAIMNGLRLTDSQREAALGNLRLVSRMEYAEAGMEMPYLSDPEFRKTVIHDVTEIHPDLAVFDNLSCLVGGSENNAEDWDLMQNVLIRLKGAGVGAMAIHHAGKGGDQRGTSRREDILDYSIKLERLGDDETMKNEFRAIFKKRRGFGPKYTPLSVLTLEIETNGDADNERLKRAVLSSRPVEDVRRARLIEVYCDIMRDTGKAPTQMDLVRALKDDPSDLDFPRSTVQRLLKTATDNRELPEGP